MATEGPRYGTAVELIRLMTALQATTAGLTIEQIMAHFEIGRRTAERRLAAVREIAPTRLDERSVDGHKHWRLTDGAVTALLRPEAAEVAALDLAAEVVARDGRPDQARLLSALSDKVRALAAPGVQSRMETDAELLLESQGLAMRPGPHPMIPVEVVEVLRRSLLACREVELDYHARVRPERAWRRVRPYGFLFGGRHYLVAHDVAADALRMYSLGDVLAARETDQVFERPVDFDLRAWARRSFGVWQDAQHDVVWRFRPSALRDARAYRFHPDQHVEEQPDGSLLVRFRAAGLWEMAWHLFSWGDAVDIVEPAELRDTLVSMLEGALAHHRVD